MLLRKTTIICIRRINRLVLIMAIQCIFCEVGAEFLNVIKVNLRFQTVTNFV
jgi:hypothetical protein